MKLSTPVTLILLLFFLLIACDYQVQPSSTDKSHFETPSLVVGIMIDQMRPDYIFRYWDKFEEGGFKRLVNEGFMFTHTHFDYMPTATGAGHAGVYTGSTPSVHGAMGNNWYVRDLGRDINVIEVPGFEGVGSLPDNEGSKGPGNLLTTTVGDELRLHTNNRSKVISMSRKDRGAILPAGHLGDAYWYEADSGNFVTSSYYYDELPIWVQEFNNRNLAREYLSEPWETLLPLEVYIESIDDDNPYEQMFRGEESPTFPHDLPDLVENHGYGTGLLSSTPFGDKLLKELAIAAIEGEKLGRRSTTDMLSVSFSATDRLGHMYGPASIEVQDAYLRLDRYLAQLLDYLDEEFGKRNILLFLTSDHGAVHVPDYLTDQGIPGGHFDSSSKMAKLSEYLTATFGEDLLLAFSNFEIFLDHDAMDRQQLDFGEVQKSVARFMLSLNGIAGALTAESLSFTEFTMGLREKVQNGFHQKRSGDVLVWLEPQFTPGTGTRGTTHGSPWGYDTHAPMLWYGFNIRPGNSSHPVFISDIASTIATFINSPYPSGNIGNPMNDHIRR